MKIISFLLLSLLLFSGCNKKESLKREIASHYKDDADSLKKRASNFLIDNIGDRYSYDSLSKSIVYDIDVITVEYIIKAVDNSFEAFQNNIFSDKVTFEQFCEYILPYKTKDGYILEDKRILFEEDYKYMKSITDKDITAPDMVDTLLKRYELMGFGTPQKVTSTPDFIKSNIAECRTMSEFNAMMFSSLGFAVTIDFIPNWGNMPFSHYWNTLLYDGNEYPFNSFFSTFKTDFYRELYKCVNIKTDKHTSLGKTRMPKVFRVDYSIKSNRLLEKENPKNIPPLFLNPSIRDISANYFKTTDVELAIPDSVKGKCDFVWLSVFDIRGLVPVFWGEIAEEKAVFEDLGRDVVYFPSYIKDGKVYGFSNPIYIDLDGRMNIMNPESTTEEVVLTRKFSYHNTNPLVWNGAISKAELMGQTGNSKQEIAFLGDKFTTFRDTIKTNSDKSFEKYIVRIPFNPIESPDNEAHNKDIRTLADINLYGYGKNGEIIELNPDYDIKYNDIFDNNTLTYCRSDAGTNDWVIEMTFDTPTKVYGVNITPKNDKNYIYPPFRYELLYWSSGNWSSLGVKQATEHSLTYNNVPKNAVLWLRCLDEGKEERIFLYQNKEQVWK